ncbi:MAG: pyruvate carboxyltransferase [Desulfobacterales bacterium]|jgi:hydroxymethylglutaryl-CoA lyase
MTLLDYSKKVVLGDITVRDGLQHEEKFIPTDAKLWLAEQLVLAGFKRIEVTNFGNPQGMPQFKDADELMKRIRGSKKIGNLLEDVEITAVTIRERAVERAIQAREEGWGPDRILFMVSTSEAHHKKNSGLSLEKYWKMCEAYIPRAHDAGMKVCGTVSTIWGCPIAGPTELKAAVDFTRRWLDIGADDIEHADHDGSAPPDKVYEYFSMILDALPEPSLHIAHFHTTRGWGLANVLTALQAGITHFESTLGGLGGQPANFVDGVPVAGTGDYYYSDPSIVGLVSTEDMVVMMDEMGIDTGVDVDKLLTIGRMFERIIGRRLRSECVHTGRIPKTLTGRA